ncbi:hypothetical protein AYO22_11252 [Fonsecaea multimorphosa]|nr:hypothetical protein AYO22_11252 [Fonsecaea multimorphosa]
MVKYWAAGSAGYGENALMGYSWRVEIQGRSRANYRYLHGPIRDTAEADDRHGEDVIRARAQDATLAGAYVDLGMPRIKMVPRKRHAADSTRPNICCGEGVSGEDELGSGKDLFTNPEKALDELQSTNPFTTKTTCITMFMAGNSINAARETNRLRLNAQIQVQTLYRQED